MSDQTGLSMGRHSAERALRVRRNGGRKSRFSIERAMRAAAALDDDYPQTDAVVEFGDARFWTDGALMWPGSPVPRESTSISKPLRKRVVVETWDNDQRHAASVYSAHVGSMQLAALADRQYALGRLVGVSPAVRLRMILDTKIDWNWKWI